MAEDKYSGCTKSSSRKAPMEGKGGNTGKPIGDKGVKSKFGNKKTRCPADRY